MSPDELSNVTTPIATSPGNGITLPQSIYPEYHIQQRTNRPVPEVHVPHGSNIQSHYFPTTHHLETTHHLPSYNYHSPSNERVVHYAVRSKSNGFGSFVGELMDHYYTREEQIYGKVNSSTRKYNGTTVHFKALDPIRLQALRDKVRRIYPEELAKRSVSHFNDIINGRCRKFHRKAHPELYKLNVD